MHEFVAPAGPPQMVSARAVSATSIFIEWMEPLIEERLGTIIAYDVYYAEALNRSSGKYKSINAGVFSTLVNNLKPYTGYSISVRARTGAGAGPLSHSYIIQTHESCKKMA